MHHQRARGQARGRRSARSARAGILVLLAVAVIAVTGPAPAAQAHAYLANSSPADGEELAAAPRELRLEFSEAVVPEATRVEVVDEHDKHRSVARVTVVAHPGESGAQAPVDVLAELPALGRGTYQVRWETLSADDLHRTTGVVVFGVGTHVTATGLDEASPQPVEAGLRWLILLGLSATLGGALAARLLGRGAASGDAVAVAVAAARRARTYAAAGALTSAGVALILLVAQLASGGGGVELLLGSYGLRWALRELGLLLLVAHALARLATPGRAARTPLLVGAGLACLGTALLGHAGAGPAMNLTRVLASAAHLGAATTWAGAVVVLTVILLGRHRGGANRVVTRPVLQRFGPPATACVAVMVVTGVYLSSEFVGSVDAALLTIYGRALVLKVALAGLAGALALASTLRLHRQARSTPRRTVIAEATVAVGILALAAALTSGQPAIEPQLVSSGSAPLPGLVYRSVGDLLETVAIRPNRPGPNVVVVDVVDNRRPAPGPISDVSVVLVSTDGSSSAPLTVDTSVPTRWSVNTDLKAAGELTVRVVVRRAGLADTVASYPWTVGSEADQSRPAVVSTAPIGPVLKVAAGALLATLLGLGSIGAIYLRRRSRPSGAAEVAPEMELPDSGRVDDQRGRTVRLR